jgi:antitoxin component YwqK of YwqJK toxin-antitoxin module
MLSFDLLIEVARQITSVRDFIHFTSTCKGLYVMRMSIHKTIKRKLDTHQEDRYYHTMGYWKHGEERSDQVMMMQISTYYFDMLHGDKKTYSMTGKLVKNSTYIYGKLKMDTSYYSTSTINNTYEYVDNKVICHSVSYTYDGNICDTGMYVDRRKDGVWITYHNNGKCEYIEHFRGDQITGPFIRYDENGMCTLYETYYENMLDGPRLTYHDNGQCNVSSYYVDGSLSGVCTKYDRDGAIIYRKCHSIDCRCDMPHSTVTVM